jgi:hypothetical protein
MKRAVAVAVLGLAALWMSGAGSAASSDVTVCLNSFVSGTITGSVVVPAGGHFCIVEPGTTITGDASVGDSSDLDIGQSASIGGSVYADSYSFLYIEDFAAIAGSVQGGNGMVLNIGVASIQGDLVTRGANTINAYGLSARSISLYNTTSGALGYGGINFFDVTTIGSLIVTGTTSAPGYGNPCIFIVLSHFGGQFIYTNNGLVACGYIWGNTIGGNMTCAANSPPPSLGGQPANIVSGQKTGQCAGL